PVGQRLLGELADPGPGFDRREDHAFERPGCGQPGVGHQVQGPRPVTSARMRAPSWARLRLRRASRRYSWSVPGPSARSAASSPATPVTIRAEATADAGSGFTAKNAPHNAVAVQPRPVTRAIRGWPLSMRMVAPSATT